MLEVVGLEGGRGEVLDFLVLALSFLSFFRSRTAGVIGLLMA